MYGILYGLHLPTVILTITCYSITHSLFHSRLKTFLFCKSFPPQPFLFLLQDSLHGFPRLFTVIFEHICFLLLVFLFLHFLVVGSVRLIKLTHVGFRAHVKIASRIVSYRTTKRSITPGKSRWRLPRLQLGRFVKQVGFKGERGYGR